MIGLSVLLVMAIYVWAAYAIAKRLPNRKAKYAVITVFVLIPTWDVIPGWVYVEYLCHKDGGIQIHKSIEGVKGIRSLGVPWGPEIFDQYGYMFVEGATSSGEVFRYSRGLNKNIEKQKVDQPLSRYGIKDNGRDSLSFNIIKQQYSAVDTQTSEILATLTYFYHRGNWIQVEMAPLLGSGSSCSNLLDFKSFYLGTLKPLGSSR